MTTQLTQTLITTFHFLAHQRDTHKFTCSPKEYLKPQTQRKLPSKPSPHNTRPFMGNIHAVILVSTSSHFSIPVSPRYIHFGSVVCHFCRMLYIEMPPHQAKWSTAHLSRAQVSNHEPPQLSNQ